MGNKVKYNIKNVHYAVKTDTGYSDPVAVPGAVSVTLEAQGELSAFYADGIKYHVSSSNGGYQGDLVMALIPDKFRVDVLGEKTDGNEVMIESTDGEAKGFALGFDIDGDKKTTRFWFFNCTATRPGTGSQTNEETITPVTEAITVSCAADSKGNIRAKTTEKTGESVYNDWYKSVYTVTDASASS